ncbi:hypothetical protein KUTeg_024273 [Tegillarca granosa]|uniref:Kinase D-interacting substrate of 220 kDa-like SAM domain-containing protein n=1 Tax=Tegillarca granosa TaxID=220873 RepID=A0ABQ9DXK5_TEGGR|nr:hypothetical protein KUTeg_024273 [Tegillarca granosa]
MATDYFRNKVTVHCDLLLNFDNTYEEYNEEQLSLMSVDDICSLLDRVTGLNPSFIQSYVSCIKDNNINGLVLSNCNLEELGKVLNMKFGDWQLFQSAILSLRNKEVEILANKESNTACKESSYSYLKSQVSEVSFIGSETYSDKTDAYNSPRNPKEFTSSQSVTDNRLYKMPQSHVEKLQRQFSVDSTKSGTYLPGDDNGFSTIPEEEQQLQGLRRNDSVYQQSQFETGLLHDAMLSFTETPMEDEDEAEDEIVDSLKKPVSDRRRLSVQFTIASQHESSPSGESNEFDEQDAKPESLDEPKQNFQEERPLLEKNQSPSLGQKAVDLARAFSGSFEKLSKPFHRKYSLQDKSKSFEDLDDEKDMICSSPSKANSTDSTGFAMAADVASSRGSPFHPDHLQVVDEVDVHQSESGSSYKNSGQRNRRSGSAEFVVQKTSPIQLVTFSDQQHELAASLCHVQAKNISLRTGFNN